MKLILSHKFGDKVRGSYKVSKRFCDNFDDLEIKSDEQIGLNDLDEYDHVFFRTQSRYSYNYRIGLSEIMNDNHTFFTRSEYNKPFMRSATNGFSYYKESDIRYLCPIITDLDVENKCNSLTIGFYIRRGLAEDSYIWFDLFLRENKIPINVYTMGDYTIDFSRYDDVLSHKHTNDNVEFFSNISHYIYPKSLNFIDPFPHSVLEASQSDVQILIPSLGERPFKDGIDDLQSVINYHTNFLPEKQLPKRTLTFEMFRPFYEKIIPENLSYKVDREKYKTFYDWISGEVV